MYSNNALKFNLIQLNNNLCFVCRFTHLLLLLLLSFFAMPFFRSHFFHFNFAIHHSCGDSVSAEFGKDSSHTRGMRPNSSIWIRNGIQQCAFRLGAIHSVQKTLPIFGGSNFNALQRKWSTTHEKKKDKKQKLYIQANFCAIFLRRITIVAFGNMMGMNRRNRQINKHGRRNKQKNQQKSKKIYARRMKMTQMTYSDRWSCFILLNKHIWCAWRMVETILYYTRTTIHTVHRYKVFASLFHMWQIWCAFLHSISFFINTNFVWNALASRNRIFNFRRQVSISTIVRWILW